MSVVYIHRGTYGTNVWNHTKVIGHLSSSKQNETDISHQWNRPKHKGGLKCCICVHSHLVSVITNLTNSCPIRDHWRSNHLISQQTNNKPVKPFSVLKNGLLWKWLTDCEHLNHLYFYFEGCTDIKLGKHQLKKKFSVSDWLIYLTEWFPLLRLCTSPQSALV